MRKLIIVCCLLLPFVSHAAIYGPTAKTDQLWQIAVLVRPNATVSIEQTMQALFKANPDAFVGGDINQLKPGVMLQIPELQAIKQVVSLKKIVVKPPKTDNKEFGVIENSLAGFGNTLLRFDQQYQERIGQLEKQNAALAQQIRSMRNELAYTDTPSEFSKSIAPYIYYLEGHIGDIGIEVLVAVSVIILLLILWWLYSWRQRSRLRKKEEKEAEYDFMGSKEGIPAKLDLARSYIDMGDNQAAKEVLKDIIDHGAKEQKEEAQELLAKIK